MGEHVSSIEVDLRLTHPHWRRPEPQEQPQESAAPGAPAPQEGAPQGPGLFVRSDRPCRRPTNPEALREHPGRLAAVEVGQGEVVLAQDRLRSWPLFWSIQRPSSPGSRGRLVVSDDAAVMRQAVVEPTLDERACRELVDAGFVSGPDTLLRDVYQVEQGSVVRIDLRTGGARTEIHSLARFDDTGIIEDPEAFAVVLEEALDAVMARMMEDLGERRLVLPLSGGLDSRLLVAWLALRGLQDRAVAFTYGLPGSREVEVSRKVAEAIGLEWHAVDYEPQVLREAWRTSAAADFLEAGYALSALPHVQDWYALTVLLERGVIRPGEVVLPGHTVVGNMHDEELLEAGPVPRRRVAQAISHHHQELQGRQAQAWADPYRAAKLKEFLSLRPYRGDARDVQSILESYNLRERQTKYINNSVRAYEHLGLDWALPMLDKEFWNAWHRGAVELTATRDFYEVFIGRLWARATGAASASGAAGDTGAAGAEPGESGAAEKPADGGQEDLPYFAVTQVDERTRSRLKSVLAATGLLPLAERSFSTWSTLHSSMAFDALITDVPRPVAAAQLMRGRKLLGFWTSAFLADTWCPASRLFSDLPRA